MLYSQSTQQTQLSFPMKMSVASFHFYVSIMPEASMILVQSSARGHSRKDAMFLRRMSVCSLVRYMRTLG